MELVIILLALSLLMFVAYRGFSVILFAPICALFAVLLTNPDWVLPFFSNIFMEKMVGFIKAYFPVFLLGAIFGKVVEMSGIAESIAKTIIRMIGAKRAILAIVLLGAILTYSGVSLFVRLRCLSVRSELVPRSEHPETPHPGNNRPWCIHVHDGCLTRNTTDSKRHPNDVLQNGYLRCTDHGNGRWIVHPSRRHVVSRVT